MWRRLCSSGTGILKRTVSAAVGTKTAPPLPTPLLCSAAGRPTTTPSSSACPFLYDRQGRAAAAAAIFPTLFFSSSSSSSCNSNTNHSSSKRDINDEEEQNDGNINDQNNNNTEMTCAEAKRLMRLVNVEALKMKLGMEAKEVISYTDLLETCQGIGITRSLDEAVAFARVLDDAGVILLFRDKVYLHPDKVVDLIRRAVPLALTPDDDPCREELKRLQQKKEEIDVLAHKQVRRILWCGLGLALFQVGLFFRLTFWEFSWDVMEPIAFFATTSSIVVGYAYFLITARDPTYQDLMKRLFLSRQRKLFKKQNFEIERFKELQAKCKTPLDATASIRNRVGMELELEDALHRY